MAFRNPGYLSLYLFPYDPNYPHNKMGFLRCFGCYVNYIAISYTNLLSKKVNQHREFCVEKSQALTHNKLNKRVEWSIIWAEIVWTQRMSVPGYIIDLLTTLSSKYWANSILMMIRRCHLNRLCMNNKHMIDSKWRVSSYNQTGPFRMLMLNLFFIFVKWIVPLLKVYI